MRTWFWLVLMAVLLNACTGISTKSNEPANPEAFKERAQRLAAHARWSLDGRVSLDDGDDGGSGKLKWVVDSGFSQLDFFAALGRGAWHLEISEGLATLKDADGEHSAPDVQSLLQTRLGWPVPVEALQFWARGLYAPGQVQTSQIDSQGLLTQLRQFGWTIDFDRYEIVGDEQLPKRLEAKHGDYRVKMVVSKWQFGDAAVAGN